MTGWPLNLENLEGTLNWDFFWKALKTWKKLEISFGIAMWANRSPWKKNIKINGPSYIIIGNSTNSQILISQIRYYIKKTTH